MTQAPRGRLSARAGIDLDRPRLIGILNVTPDSFADGGLHADARAGADHAARLVEEGADAIDVGGESTRPGAGRVRDDEQVRRVVPIIERVRAMGGPAGAVPIIVDTTRAAVARAALDAGADAVNDVSGGTDDALMLALAGSRGAGIILMHRLVEPARDSYSDAYVVEPAYADVVGEVASFLEARVAAAMEAGVAREGIVVDPGLGFGKTVAQNLALIRATPRLASGGRPVLSACSRKSFVGRVALGRDSRPGERLEGTLGVSVVHLMYGARLFRVHDVREHAAALRAAWTTAGEPSIMTGANRV